MKKLLSVFLAAIMVLCIVIPSFAATANISASKNVIKKGETVDVTVSLSEKAESVLNFEYNVYFDADLFELKSSKIGGASELTAISEEPITDTKGNYYSVSLLDASSKGVEVKAGTVYTLTFTAIKDVTEESAASFEVVRESYAVLSGGKIVKNKDGDIGTGKAEITVKVKGENVPTFSDIYATVSAPAFVDKTVGTEFNAIVYSTEWDENEYKLLDALLNIPAGIEVTSITAGDRLSGGEVSYNLDSEGKLRIVYNDTAKMSTIALSGTDFPAILFTVGLKIGEDFNLDEGTISIGGMSLKLSSDSEIEYSQHVLIIPTEKDEQGNTGSAVITFSKVISMKVAELFAGDGIDLIPEDKKAILISITGLSEQFIKDNSKLTYKNGEKTATLYLSEEISTLTGNRCYVAIVDKTEELQDYANWSKYVVDKEAKCETLLFGDTNGDGLINAQDALNIINAWIRKTEVKTDKEILAYNVNSDARINTYDALAIEEAFVNSAKMKIVTRAAALTSKSE